MRASLTVVVGLMVCSFAGCCKKGDDSKASPSSQPSATSAPTTKTDDPKEVRYDKFPGPSVPVNLGGITDVWAVKPVSTNFDSVKFDLSTAKKIEGDVVLVDGYRDTWVPGAWIQKAEAAKGLKKGTPVMVDEAAAGPLGRVVDPGASPVVKYMFASSVSTSKPKPNGMWVLQGTVRFAEPVGYKDGPGWKQGRVAYTGKEQTWVVPYSGKPKQVPTSTVKAMNILTIYKKGDKVWARSFEDLKPGTVEDVIEEGVAYKVKFDSTGKTEQLSFGEVTKPLE